MDIVSDNHKALVCKVHVREFPGADRLQLGLCNGFQVIVGKEVQDGTLGLFFQEGLQLSEEFAKANDLVRRKDEQGNACGGMFADNRRVRTIKLRGQQSFGFWIALSAICGGRFDSLKEGDLIDEFSGMKLCQKYITKATRNARGTQRSTRRGEVFGMPKHFDTVQFKREYERVPKGARIIFSEKAHGCVSSDTVLETLLGPKIIGEIVDNKIPAKVKSFNINTGEIEYRDVTNYFCYEKTDNWYKIDLSNGKSLRVTGEHLIWYPKLKCYRQVKDLVVGDILLSDES